MFSWDAAKALRNYVKHGVPFEEATTVFRDAHALDVEDEENPAPERRWIRVGLSTTGRVIVVIYTLRRLEDGTETIRIISARQANRRERKAYAG